MEFVSGLLRNKWHNFFGSDLFLHAGLWEFSTKKRFSVSDWVQHFGPCDLYIVTFQPGDTEMVSRV